MVYLIALEAQSLNLLNYEVILYLTFLPISLNGDTLLKVHVRSL